MTERRTDSRYPIHLPVLLEQGAGETRDIGTRGVYILTSQHYPSGSDIAFTLHFDFVKQPKQKPLFFACRGRVLRTEQHAGMNGLAISFLDDAHNQPFSASAGDGANLSSFSTLLVDMAALHQTGL